MIQNAAFYLSVRDHSVSGEMFSLEHDPTIDMLITNPQPDDLSRYYESPDYISHTDSSRGIFEKAYQFVKSIAIKKKLALIENIVTKGRLLDIGSGTGDFAIAAKHRGWDVSAVEPSARAREFSASKGINAYEQTQHLENHAFDVITMWHVLEHVRDPRAQISELRRLLKPNGVIIVAVPNFKSYDANHYGSYWAAYDVPRHLFHYSAKAISALFAEQGLEVRKSLPMWFDAFYVALLSEKYKTGKMNVFRAGLIGLKSNLHAARTKEASSRIYIIGDI